MKEKAQDLPQDDYIRHKLFSGKRSIVQRYTDLVVQDGSVWTLLEYELITTLFGNLPGALGLALRKVFYPLLFARVGKGVIFGRSLTIRNPQRISLGDRVMIDDYSLIDARGAGAEGIVIGDETIINRGAVIQAKRGHIHIGAATDIGAGTAILSQGGHILIGDMVTLGGGCKVGGGSVRLASADSPASVSSEDRNDFSARGQARESRGPIEIGDRCLFAMSVTVLDGVKVGADSTVGACALLREDVPAGSAVMPHERLVVVSRDQFRTPSAAFTAAGTDAALSPTAGGSTDPAKRGAPEASVPAEPSAEPRRITAGESEATLHTVFRTLDLVNAQLPAHSRIARDLGASLIEPAGPLDSLGLINLVVTLEDAVAEDFGVRVALSDTLAGRSERNPFESVGSLVLHVNALIGRSS
jgi:acetyltransferase-like isoleucine patch superfamily enzyme